MAPSMLPTVQSRGVVMGPQSQETLRRSNYQLCRRMDNKTKLGEDAEPGTGYRLLVMSTHVVLLHNDARA